jgi:hypothetical protein
MERNKRAGWYVRFDMHKTLAFWDGRAWTDQTAPSYKGLEPSVWTIAGGVALGGIILGCLGILVSVVNLAS